LAILTFTSCADDPTPEPTYKLTAILPSPAVPGDTISVFGTLPKDLTLTLIHPSDSSATTEIGTTPIFGGAEFTLPKETIAGELTINIQAGDTAMPDSRPATRLGSKQLSGKLQVLPKIESARIEATRLILSGVGWPTNPAGISAQSTLTHLEVGSQVFSPQLEANSLVVPLPNQQTYGAMEIRVKVGEQVSHTYTLLREAGTVSGRVELAAQVSQVAGLRSQINSNPNPASASKALVFYHQAKALPFNINLLGGLKAHTTLFLSGHYATRLLFDSDQSANQAKTQLRSTPGISHIESDPIISSTAPQAATHPVRQSVRLQSTPATPGQGQWHLPLLGLTQVWSKTHGQGVVVAVVDTGVLLDHPDLKANLLPGYDFVDDDAIPGDTAGHGTHVAGLIAANGLALGAAPRARLLPVKVLSGTSGGSAFTVAQGILWAADLLPGLPNPNPAQIINLSLGSSEYSAPMADAVRQAIQKGVLVVAASGNDGSSALSHPAATDGVISVTALAGPKTAYQPFYATKGPGLQVAAYGGDLTQDQDHDGKDDGILSTDIGEAGKASYSLRMGTSMASPLVSGMAALALSSGTSPNFLAATLTQTATDLGVLGYDHKYGYGLITARVGNPSTPRTYLVASLSGESQTRHWTLVQSDLRFVLSNLPPGQAFTLMAATDSDNDQIVGEAGEMLSAPQAFIPQGGQSIALAQPLILNPSDGSQAIALAKP
jgi:serine protease